MNEWADRKGEEGREGKRVRGKEGVNAGRKAGIKGREVKGRLERKWNE